MNLVRGTVIGARCSPPGVYKELESTAKSARPPAAVMFFILKLFII
jgi:hypothetical protein